MAGAVVVRDVALTLANLASQWSSAGSSGPLAPIALTITRLATSAFAGAMALQQIAVAPMIVSIAFGLLFGRSLWAVAWLRLGGNGVASEQLAPSGIRFDQNPQMMMLMAISS